MNCALPEQNPNFELVAHILHIAIKFYSFWIRLGSIDTHVDARTPMAGP